MELSGHSHLAKHDSYFFSDPKRFVFKGAPGLMGAGVKNPEMAITGRGFEMSFDSGGAESSGATIYHTSFAPPGIRKVIRDLCLWQIICSTCSFRSAIYAAIGFFQTSFPGFIKLAALVEGR